MRKKATQDILMKVMLQFPCKPNAARFIPTKLPKLSPIPRDRAFIINPMVLYSGGKRRVVNVFNEESKNISATVQIAIAKYALSRVWKKYNEINPVKNNPKEKQIILTSFFKKVIANLLKEIEPTVITAALIKNNKPILSGRINPFPTKIVMDVKNCAYKNPPEIVMKMSARVFFA